jgi:hypothetical protein
MVMCFSEIIYSFSFREFSDSNSAAMLFFVNLYLAIGHKAKAIRIFSAIEALKKRGDMHGDLHSGWSTNVRIYVK